jgi:hypothetical protein
MGDRDRRLDALIVLLLGVAVAGLFHRIVLHQVFLWGDFLVQAYPFRTFAAVSLANGELPLWNPYAFSGMPFQADIQSAVFYVPHLLLTAFVRDGRLPFYIVELTVVAHVWLATVTMYFLARDLELERAYATFAGVVFALSGFMIVHLFQPGFVEELAWLPLIVLCLRRSVDRRSVPYAVIAGMINGHAILAGAPQISLYITLLVGAYMAFRLFDNGPTPRPIVFALGAVALVVTLGVAAVQLLPTAELGGLSERAEMSLAAAQEYRLEWRQFATAVIPRLYGAAGGGFDAYWGGGPYGTFWETCFYWGLPALFAAACALVFGPRGPLVWFLGGVVIVSALLAVGDQFVLHRLFYAVVPGFSKFRAMGRSMSLATFAVAILAAFGLRALVAEAVRAPRRVHITLGAALAVTVVLWIAVRAGVFLPIDPNVAIIRRFTFAEARAALLITAAIVVVGTALVKAWVPPRVAVMAFLALQYADMVRFGAHQNDGPLDGDTYYNSLEPAQREIIDQLKKLAADEHFRVTSRGLGTGAAVLDRHQGMMDRIQLTDGFNPLRLARLVPPARDREATLDLLGSRFRLWYDSAANAFDAVESRTYLPRAWMVHAARVIADDSATATFMRSTEFDPRRTVVLAESLVSAAAHAADAPPSDANVAVTDYRLNSIRLRVATRAPGFLVLSEIHYPGWHATVSGTPAPVLRANWNLRAVPVGAGQHDVELRFAPRSFRIGAIISVLTLVACAFVLIRAGIGSRRHLDSLNDPHRLLPPRRL